MLLLQYTISKCRPLKGVRKTIFILTAGPIFIALFLLNIGWSYTFFPNVMDGLFASHSSVSPKGRALIAWVTTTPLSVLALWLWYRFLLFLQPKSQTELKCKSQIGLWQLSPVNIKVQNSNANYGEALIFRLKESRPVSEYYFIIINGEIVAALGSGEFTKVKLQDKVNEIGCYAKPSNDNFNAKYKLNVENFEADQSVPLALTVTPDIFVGSSIRKIHSKKAQKYQTVCNYVEQGPRHNTAT